MATAESVKDALQAIVTKSNAKTGGADTTVTAAADRLIAGYNPNGITPSGTKNITANGSHDVTAYATAQVNVPVGITPSGTKEITENGQYDISAFAAVNVAVPTDGGQSTPQIAEVYTINIANTLGNGTNSSLNLLTGNEFVKKHYADNGFFAYLLPVSPLAGEQNVMYFVCHGNANIGNTSAARYGCFFYGTSATAVGMIINSEPIKGTAYNIALRARSTGNLTLYCASARIVKAGTYMLVLVCAD